MIKNQVRNTVQRAIVLSTVNLLQNHPTADEVYNEIYKTHPTISRGTVYRNLNVLASSGQITKIEMPDSADRFDHTLHKHYHVKCSVCGDFTDVDVEYIDEINSIIEQKTKYVLDDHAIVFKGVCKNCQKS